MGKNNIEMTTKRLRYKLNFDGSFDTVFFYFVKGFRKLQTVSRLFFFLIFFYCL